MPSLEFFVVSSTISIDQRTNRLSILEVIEDLEPVRFPARMARLTALTLWKIGPQERDQDFQAVLRVSCPGLEQPAEFRQNFIGDGPTQRMLFHLLRVPVLGQGTILFELFLNEQRVASHEIRVAPADAAAPDDGFLEYAAPDDEGPRE